jgi:hypothetical protein
MKNEIRVREPDDFILLKMQTKIGISMIFDQNKAENNKSVP